MASTPIIIIGMHRSGTSLVARLLDALGLYQGRRLDANHEAVYFQRINDWLLRQAGAAWDHPEPIDHLLAHEGFRRLAGDHVESLLAGPHRVGFAGWRGLVAGDLRRLGRPWGFKDPRSTFTLPIWRDVLPEARVVHVIRCGVDVAASLVRRVDRRLQELERHPPACGWGRFRLRPFEVSLTNTIRCADLEEGLALWERYVRRGRQHVAELGERAIEVRYEDILAGPVEQVRALAAFAGVTDDAQAIGRLTGSIRADRAFAYRRDRSLVELADRWAPRLAELGYPVEDMEAPA